MGFRYAVLGAGRQGTAAAYDLVLRGDADSVVLADRDGDVAGAAARRVEELSRARVARGSTLDVTDREALVGFLEDVDAFLSAVPYFLNLDIARAAIAAGAHMCDLGGNTDLVRRQLELHDEATAAGVRLVPDCGQVPGMGTTLMARAVSLLDEPRGVKMWDGGIPADPEPPWNYALTFHIAGLTNEYDGTTLYLRDGELVEVACFDRDEYDLVEFPEPFGRLEAFATAGGTSTMPLTYHGRLEYLENSTLRYPGHAAQWKAFSDAGLLGLEPVRVGNAEVVPRDLLHALMAPRLEPGPDFRDVVLVRVVASGRHEGAEAEVQLDLVDRYDDETGFTAMQRTTGWDGAIVAAMMAREQTPPGAVPRELAVDPALYVEELARRGFDYCEDIRT